MKTLGPNQGYAVSRLRCQQWLFNGLVVYYWAIHAFADLSVLEHGGPLHYALVLPIVLYSAAGLPYLARLRYKAPAILLSIYLVVLAIVSSARGDFALIGSTMLFAVPIIVVLNSGVKIPARLLIGLFWLTVLWGGVSYYLGLNQYGILPGQATTHLHQGLWWRVSMFPHKTPPYTALFAVIILYGICFLGWRFKFRNLTALGAAYFLVLPGSRAMLLVAAVVFAFSFLARRLPQTWRRLLPIGLMATLALSMLVVASPVLLMNLGIDSPLLASLVYRRTEIPTSAEQLAAQFTRPRMWREYSAIASENLLVGVGSFRVTDYFPDSKDWTESRAWSLFARDGLVSLLFFAGLYYTAKLGLVYRHWGYVFYATVVLVALLYYSSYLNTYNFVYLCILGLLNHHGASHCPQEGASQGDSDCSHKGLNRSG